MKAQGHGLLVLLGMTGGERRRATTEKTLLEQGVVGHTEDRLNDNSSAYLKIEMDMSHPSSPPKYTVKRK